MIRVAWLLLLKLPPSRMTGTLSVGISRICSFRQDALSHFCGAISEPAPSDACLSIFFCQKASISLPSVSFSNRFCFAAKVFMLSFSTLSSAARMRHISS